MCGLQLICKAMEHFILTMPAACYIAEIGECELNYKIKTFAFLLTPAGNSGNDTISPT